MKIDQWKNKWINEKNKYVNKYVILWTLKYKQKHTV